MFSSPDTFDIGLNLQYFASERSDNFKLLFFSIRPLDVIRLIYDNRNKTIVATHSNHHTVLIMHALVQTIILDSLQGGGGLYE